MTASSTNLRRFAGFVCIAAAFALIGCGPSHKEVQQKAQDHWGEVRGKIKVQLARQTLERGQVDETVKILQDALRFDSKNPDALVLLSRCQLEQGQVAAAQRTIDAASESSPVGSTAEIAYVRAQIAERRGESVEALAQYEQARTLDDTKIEYLLGAAQCLVGIQRPQDALTLLQEKLVDYGNNPTIHALIGEIAMQNGDKELAERSFRAVLATGAINPAIAEEYALLIIEEGRYEEVLNVLAALRAAGDVDLSPSVRLAAARAMLALGQVEPAKLELAKLVERNSDNLAAWYMLGHAGILSDDLPAIERSAAQAQRIAPDAAQSLLLQAYACLKEGRLAEAQATLQSLRRVSDQDPLVHCMLGWAARQQRDQGAARQHFRRALELDPACAWAKTELATLEGKTF
jgi:Tfp pilus assembly protein PilF